MSININQILANSLIELTYTKPIDKITVQNIIDNCDIGRQTFYNHFKDKFELIEWIYNSKANEILSAYDQNEPSFEFLRHIYLLFLENKQFYTNISKLTGQNSFADFIFHHTKNYYMNSIIKRYGKDEITDSLIYSIEFAVFGAMNMHFKWIRGGMKESPEKMAIGIIENVPLNLRKYFY